MIKKWLHNLCFICAFSINSALAQTPTLAELPLNAPVIDEVGVLNEAEKHTIAQQLRQWHQTGIMQAAVVILPDAQGLTAFEAAMVLAKRWQLGSKTANNGLLLFIAFDEREFFAVTGSGLEGALPDVSIKRILRDKLVPHFKEHAYHEGIEAALGTFVARLQADPETQAQLAKADARSLNAPDIVLILLFLFIFLALIGVRIFGKYSALPIGIVAATVGYFIWASTWWAVVIGGAYAALAQYLMPRLLSITSTTKHHDDSSHFNHTDEPTERIDTYDGGGGDFNGGGAGGKW